MRSQHPQAPRLAVTDEDIAAMAGDDGSYATPAGLPVSWGEQLFDDEEQASRRPLRAGLRVMRADAVSVPSPL